MARERGERHKVRGRGANGLRTTAVRERSLPEPIRESTTDGNDCYLESVTQYKRSVARFQKLLDVYAEQVRDLRDRTSTESSWRSLAAWSLRKSANGYALVENGRIRIVNGAFSEMDRSCAAEQPWERVAAPADSEAGADHYANVYALVVGELAAAEARGGGPHVRHFSRGDRHISLSLERSQDPAQHRVLATVREEAPLRPIEHSTREDKLQTLGRLAIGVAHDLTNILGSLSMRLALVRLDPTCRAQIDNVEIMNEILRSCTARVRTLQAFAHVPVQELESVDLIEVITSAVAIAEGSLHDQETRKVVRVAVALPPLPMVQGSADELRHVFINLLLNARDAMEDGGTITIKGRFDGDSVEVSVQDQGTGIPPGIIDQIFEPFFTTKGSNGMGIGLAVAKDTLQRFGGSIRARNLPSGGACFDLRFAVSSEDGDLPM